MEREYLHLEYLIYHYSPAYSPTWKAWFTDSIHDKSKLTFDLAEELLKNNEFDEPVILSKEHKTVLNGMHRIMAHYITGLPRIYVSYSYPKEALTTYLICANITVKNKKISKNWDQLFNEIATILSFRYREGEESIWVKCEGDYCNGENKELYLHLSSSNININNFINVLNERLSPYSIQVNKVSWV